MEIGCVCVAAADVAVDNLGHPIGLVGQLLVVGEIVEGEIVEDAIGRP
jgi:hypothetical protein